MSAALSDPGYGDLSVGIILTLERGYRSVLCCPRSENTRSRTRSEKPCSKAGGSGIFGDDGQLAAKPCFTVIVKSVVLSDPEYEDLSAGFIICAGRV